MKKSLTFLLFLTLGLLPIYLQIGWIFIFNKYSNYTQAEKVKYFNDEIIFGFNILHNRTIILLALFCGIVSLGNFIFRASERQQLNRIQKISFTTIIILIATSILLTVWSLM